ncbi:MAG: NAD(P)H-binding protein [Pseudomonadota bacterium]
MRILIIGGSKGIGLETVKAGLECGHDVRAFARSASRIAIEDDRLEKVDGDATDEGDLSAALNGMDAVVETLGVPLSLDTVLHGTTLYSKVGRVMVDLMERQGPKRLIAVTGLGAGNARDHLGPLFQIGFQFSLKRIYDDKDIEEQIIKASTLDWTIARPGILRDGTTTGLYQVLTDPTDWRVGEIRRSDVAHFVITELETPRYVHQTPLLIA